MRIASVAALAAVLVGCCDRPVRDDDVSVTASSFGWNATNATKCLQAALDSGARRVVVDRQEGDWIIEPVFLRSDQEVVIADGVTVRALKGAFKGVNDCLFTASGVSNLTVRGAMGTSRPTGSCGFGETALPVLKMERDDYADRKAYKFSEWRHTLKIVNSCNVRVSDLAFRASGGDGVYVGGASRDIDIRRVDCRDHWRQGLSVTGAENLYVADSRFLATKGTPPACGVDFEPSKPTDRLVNCVLENCDMDGNAVHGFTLNLISLNETSEPISAVVRNCRMRGNAQNGCTLTVGLSLRGKRPPKGTVLVEGCEISGNGARPLAVNCVSRETASILVKDTVMDARGSTFSGIAVSNNEFSDDCENLTFENSRLIVDGEAVEFSARPGAGIRGIGGTLTVERGGKAEPFDFAAFAARHRPNPALRKAFGSGAKVDFTRLRPIVPDAVVKKPTPRLRGKFTFLQYLPEAGEYTLEFRVRKMGNRTLNCPVQMFDMLGTDLGVFSITAAVQKVTIKATERNLRRLAVNTRNHIMTISSPYPGQGVLADQPVGLFTSSCQLYFSVPEGAKKVFAAVSPDEPAAADLLNAEGESVDSMARRTGGIVTLSGERKSEGAEIWSLDVKPDEDVKVWLGSSVLPVFFVDPAAGLVEK